MLFHLCPVNFVCEMPCFGEYHSHVFHPADLILLPVLQDFAAAYRATREWETFLHRLYHAFSIQKLLIAITLHSLLGSSVI